MYWGGQRSTDEWVQELIEVKHDREPPFPGYVGSVVPLDGEG